MDAKAKAEFINSVAGGQGIPCPKCNGLNKAGSNFCVYCGSPLGNKSEKDHSADEPVNNEVDVKKEHVSEKVPPVSEPVINTEETVTNSGKGKTEPYEEYEDSESIFAEGLPDWDMVPPQVVVRRKRK